MSIATVAIKRDQRYIKAKSSVDVKNALKTMIIVIAKIPNIYGAAEKPRNLRVSSNFPLPPKQKTATVCEIKDQISNIRNPKIKNTNAKKYLKYNNNAC